MRYVISIPSLPLADYQHETFVFGARFNCLKTGDAWNEETKTVGRDTTALQHLQFGAIKLDDPEEYYYIKCLCEFEFTDVPMVTIKTGLQLIPEVSRTEIMNLCLLSLEGLTEDDLLLSVVDYCDTVLVLNYPELESIDV
jgi:hypothetical protein